MSCLKRIGLRTLMDLRRAGPREPLTGRLGIALRVPTSLGPLSGTPACPQKRPRIEYPERRCPEGRLRPRARISPVSSHTPHFKRSSVPP